MSQRDPAAPFPEKSVELLTQAIDLIEGPKPTGDESEQSVEPPGILARLVNHMKDFDPAAYPPGAVGRVAEVSAALNMGKVGDARRQLKLLLESWQQFWHD